MKKIQAYFKKISKNKKWGILVCLFSFTLLLSIAIPSLARFKNRNTMKEASVWSGAVATSYSGGNGSINNPYIISSGEELAFFSNQLRNTNYENKYFKLSKDIVMNNGSFYYSNEDGAIFVTNETNYYLKEFSNELYSSSDRTGSVSGTVNLFSSLNNFKGNFDGDFHTISGIYISSNNAKELALFTSLNGVVSNLYLENSLIYGGDITAGIASTAINSNINNVLFNGNVIGNNLNRQDESTVSLENINITTNEPLIEDSIVISNQPFIPGIGSHVYLSGSVIKNISTDLTINNVAITEENFEIDLGTNIVSNIPLTVENSLETDNVTISNLEYRVVYNSSITGGIVGVASGTGLAQVINKATIHNSLFSGGLIGLGNNINIVNSYNEGTIDSNTSGGLVGSIVGNNNMILKSYNSALINGTISGGIIGSINNSSVSIEKAFDTENNSYKINSVNNSSVQLTNCYSIYGTTLNSGSISTTFESTSLANLQSESFPINTLGFNKYLNKANLTANPSNLWIYEANQLPILYYDDIENALAQIHVRNYSWNNLSDELDTLKFNANFSFSINENNANTVKEIYYYINEGNTPLLKTDLDNLKNWQRYSNVVEISQEGIYGIYAKVIDYKNNITYLNSDTIILDTSGSIVEISNDSKTWDDLRTTLDYQYIINDNRVSISATDDLSGIKSIEYLISTGIYANEDLAELEDSAWSNYTQEISINNPKTIVYAKVTDNCDYVTYANTDYLLNGGYSITKSTIGNNLIQANSILNITNKSLVTLNFQLESEKLLLSGESLALISNQILPANTIITLKDNINNKIYRYKTTSNDYGYTNSCSGKSNCQNYATYNLADFYEVGRNNKQNYFSISGDINDSINENYTISFDFKLASISNNINNLAIKLNLLKDSNVMIPTIEENLKTINIYKTVNNLSSEATLTLESQFDETISLNSNSVYQIDLTQNLNNTLFNGNQIYDSQYDDQFFGLMISLVDEDGIVISQNNYKNLIFTINGDEYYPDANNAIRIKLSNARSKNNSVILQIESKTDNILLEENDYYFKINGIVSYDGIYEDNLITDDLLIPVTVENTNYDLNNHSFEVINDNETMILNKTSLPNLSFRTLYDGKIKSKNIQLALFKKTYLRATDLNYTLLDLNSYVSNNNLTLKENNHYLIPDNIILNWLPNQLQRGAYKLEFSLYDNNKKISTINQYFIIK